MKHLSSVDATFLHMESAEMPMHLGFLNVMDLPPDYHGNFFEDVKAYLLPRMHLADVFTRKLAPMPFDVSDPIWVEDENIDIDYHVRHVHLPTPGSNRQLQQLVSRLHSSLLDRSRPLWELFVIDGLKSRQVAVYVKVHHAGVDGQAGVAFAAALYDEQPSGRVIPPPPVKTTQSQYEPRMLELLSGAVVNTVNQYTKMLWTIPEMARTAFGLLPSIGNSGNGPLRLLTGRGVFAPKTSFNVSITNQRSFAGRTVPLAEVKEIGKRLGASVNDVMMATVSGALRRFLQGRQELPDRSLTAAVPVSLRQAGDTTANNQVSVMLVSLATNLDDPAQRLRHIKESSDSAKATLGQIKAILPTDLPVLGAPWLISGLASLYGRARVADLLPPVANLIISNVPGVPVPLYFAGARLASYYPVSLPAHGMALNVTVQSYNGRLDYGLIGCRRALPDLNGFGDLLLNEHRDLLILAREPNAGVTAQEPAPISIVKTGTGGTS